MPQKLISNYSRSHLLRPFALLAWGLFVGSMFLPLSTNAYYDIGPIKGYVTDISNVLPASVKNALENNLRDFEAKTSHQIAIVIIPSLKGDTIEGFSNTLFEQIKIGQKEADNGVLLLIAIDEREARIEVGYGLEGALTDIESKQILENNIFPYFKQGNYAQGILEGTDATQKAIQGEIVTKGSTARSTKNSGSMIVWGIFIVITLFASLARTKSWWAGGLLGGIIGVIVFLITGILLIIPSLAIVGLIADYSE